MTAIAAIVAFKGATPTEHGLDDLLHGMRQRGPDGRRAWSKDAVALGEGLLDPRGRPLSELPSSQREMASLGVLHIAWDGRIDNRAELLAGLMAAGDIRATLATELPDRELVLMLFRRHGERMPELLLGDFAFAIWNVDSQSLFCARDCMGARPFYYTLQPGYFALASEDEALLALPDMDRSPNMERVAYALCPAFNAFDWQQSWLEQVYILMPGTAITITAERRFRRWNWWRWERPDEQRFESDEQALEAFGAVMEQAVRDRTRDLDSVGVIASGGMDTATVAVAASRVRESRPLRFFSTVDDDLSRCIESRAIEALAKTLGADLNRLHVPSMRGMCSQTDLDAFYERPHPVDASISLVAMMCLGASRTGQRVLLHGATGDLAMHATDDYLLRFAAERGWMTAIAEAQAASKYHTYVAGTSVPRQFARAAYHEWVPAVAKRAWRDLRRTFRGAHANWLCEAGDLGLQVQIARRTRNETHQSERASRAPPRTVAEHLDALLPFGIVRGLEGYERVAGRYGVELRDPWADRRVMAFCLALPIGLLAREGRTKYLARRWVGVELPDECVWRSDKAHLGQYLLPSTMPELAHHSKEDISEARTTAEGANTQWKVNTCARGADAPLFPNVLKSWLDGLSSHVQK
ncbi:MAG: hypothetical protein IAE92_09450 [Burkholderiaceae bacterium]|nr:hypothetical protein [Burkholderiaceae bacterium]